MMVWSGAWRRIVATRRGPWLVPERGRLIVGLIQHLEEQAIGGTAGMALRQEPPQRIDQLEAALRLGRMQAAQPVAGMQVEAHAKAKTDQGIDGGVELRKPSRHVVPAAEGSQQPFRRDRKTDMGEAASPQAGENPLIRAPCRLAVHPAGQVEPARQSGDTLALDARRGVRLATAPVDCAGVSGGRGRVRIATSAPAKANKAEKTQTGVAFADMTALSAQPRSGASAPAGIRAAACCR